MLIDLKLFYFKWIKKQCPHFCCLCNHKSWCYDSGKENVLQELIKSDSNMKRLKNKYKYVKYCPIGLGIACINANFEQCVNCYFNVVDYNE